MSTLLAYRWLALDAALPSIRTPTLLCYGTAEFPDALPERAAEQMPHATVVALEGLNHAQAFRRSDLVLPHVRRFLDQVGSMRLTGGRTPRSDEE